MNRLQILEGRLNNAWHFRIVDRRGVLIVSGAVCYSKLSLLIGFWLKQTTDIWEQGR